MNYGQEAVILTEELNYLDYAASDSQSDASTASGRVSQVGSSHGALSPTGGLIAELMQIASKYHSYTDDLTQSLDDLTQLLADPTLLPGELATKGNLERADIISRLTSFLQTISGLPDDDEFWITEEAKEAALSIIEQLPRQTPLPRLATDGEGGVILTWEIEGRSHLVIVDGQHLEIVENAATAHTNYLDPIPYSPGSRLPLRLAQLLTE